MGEIMLTRIHEKLGTAGFVLAIIALVAALGGAAYAAGGLTAKQEKQVKKIAKKYAGKNGKDGAQGAKGDTGAQGAKGDTGAQGPQGPQGPEGPVGPEGPEGSPWTVNGTLPSGRTETGAWGFGATANAGWHLVPVSFNIPLKAAPTLHVINVNGKELVFNSVTEEFEEVDQPACPGSATEPKAKAGTLCLYGDGEEPGEEKNILLGGYPPQTKTYTTGAVVGFLTSAAAAQASGTWAVTAP
jgi:hypothetical protein